MYLRMTLSLLLFLAVAIAARLWWPAESAAQPAAPKPPAVARPMALDPPRPKVDPATSRPLKEITIDAADLPTALRQFQQITDANLIWLDIPGGEYSHPVKLKLKNVTVGSALLAVLHVGSRGTLGFTSHDGVLVVRSASEIPASGVDRPDLLGRIYDVRTLCGIGEGTGDPPRTREESAQNLMTLIVETIEPESWRENGGFASLRYWEGLFIIQQTPETHARVAALLDEVREMLATPPGSGRGN